jgi:hypothetical protein
VAAGWIRLGQMERIGSVPMRDGEVKAVIFHINRITPKKDLTEEQRQAGLDRLRQAGADNPAVRSWIVGRELGGEFECGAVFVVDDLDGYWQNLTHPAHVRSEIEGIPFLEKFVAFDVTDSDDPEIGEKIARLQARHVEESPELAALEAQAPSFSVPGSTGQSSAVGGQTEA